LTASQHLCKVSSSNVARGGGTIKGASQTPNFPTLLAHQPSFAVLGFTQHAWQ